jgi:hypothetical protein
MSAGESLENIVSRARELGRNYDWMGCVELYRTVLGIVSGQDVQNVAETRELIGYGLFRAACQADSVEEFKKRMLLSVESYEKAAELFEKINNARSLYCRAMARYSDSWFAEDSSQKKELLDDCWRLMKEALESFDAAGDRLGFGKAFHGLSVCFLDRDAFEGSWHELKWITEEVISYGQNAIAKLSQVGDVNELAWACTMTSLFIVGFALDLFHERREEFVSVISDYSEKALELSAKIEDAYLNAFLYYTMALSSVFVKGDLQAALGYSEKILEQGRRSNDHYLFSFAYFALNIVTSFVATTEEDPDKCREQNKLAIRFAEESIRHSLFVCWYTMASRAYHSFLVDSYLVLAELETSLERKVALLKEAAEIGRKGSDCARLSGAPGVMHGMFHSLSKAILFLSETEAAISEKKELLEEALELRQKAIKIQDQLFPPIYWDSGVSQNYLALIKADLAKMEKGEEKKRRLLEEAVSCMEKCLDICTKHLQNEVAPLPRGFAVLGWYHDWFGEILDQLYSLTKDEKVMNRAIEVCQGAAQVYQKAGMPSRVAEAYWKAARLCDRLGEYDKASDNFELAARSYQLVAEKIPQFKCFYTDHKSYMLAWSQFEKAKLAHQKEEYEQSKTHYESAANLLKSTKRWSYLAPNFSAWATLEQAEDLSKKEKSDESKQAFQQAAQQFCEAKASIEEKAKKIESPDEKAKALELSNASEYRSEYSLARAKLEEAKIHEQNEEHGASAKNYGAAAERFEKIAAFLEDESERKELLFQASMCRALEKMELAEEKAEPDLYAEASELFTKTQKITSRKRNALLALGNACFCKALESGTKFKITPNAELYTTAKQYMERAAHHYTEAGFETAAKWTKATQRLFDAYFYMCNAESELDPEKKAKHYQLAEKHLDLAARLYETAGYISKRDEILRHLERVKEEKELLISPTEILKAPSVVSATPTISAPTPTNEEPVGLEGFEHANIQANLIIRLKEVKVGENLDLEIELVNAGKRPALLIKTEQIIPEGFEIKEKPEIYRVEDSYLNMKGKRLDPLKTEEVKLVLKALAKGTFNLKPRILYLDENGKYRSYETEPVTVKVKELGVSGWLKGA